MKNQFLYTALFGFLLISCSSSNKTYNSFDGAWLSTEVSETYIDDYKGTIENSYDFKSALVISNNEFMWNYWGEFGNYSLSNNGKSISMSLENEECHGRCSWELISYSSKKLVFLKSDDIVGTEYSTSITFNRL